MSTSSVVESLDSDFIEDLLFNIEERRVVTIVGPELLIVEHEGQQVLLYRFLAERLAERLRIPLDQLPPEASIAEVAALHARQSGDIEEVYSRLRAIMERYRVRAPQPLRKLAEIS